MSERHTIDKSLDGRGRVLVSEPWRYGLPPGINGRQDVDEYGVAVFHQLHCLGVLRQGWFAFLADLDPVTENKYAHLGTAAAIHCFEYLRQSVMCSADTTIESVSYWGFDGKVHGAHGWGVQHQCKDWDAVWDWTEKHHAESNRTGI